MTARFTLLLLLGALGTATVLADTDPLKTHAPIETLPDACQATLKHTQSCADDDWEEVSEKSAQLCTVPRDGQAGHLCSPSQVSEAMQSIERDCPNHLQQTDVQASYTRLAYQTYHIGVLCLRDSDDGASSNSTRFCRFSDFQLGSWDEDTDNCGHCTKARTNFTANWQPPRKMATNQQAVDDTKARSEKIKRTCETSSAAAHSAPLHHWALLSSIAVGIVALAL